MRETNEDDHVVILGGISDQDVLDFLDTICLVKKPQICSPLLQSLFVQTQLKSHKGSKPERSLSEKLNIGLQNICYIYP